MAKSDRKMKIADLVPYETDYTGPKYDKAVRDLKRDGEFTKPVPVFQVEGHWFARDGTHHIKAWLDLGHDEVPVKETDAPADARELRENLEMYLSLKGFGNLPKTNGLAGRGSNRANSTTINKDDLLQRLKEIAERKTHG